MYIKTVAGLATNSTKKYSFWPNAIQLAEVQQCDRWGEVGLVTIQKLGCINVFQLIGICLLIFFLIDIILFLVIVRVFAESLSGPSMEFDMSRRPAFVSLICSTWALSLILLLVAVFFWCTKYR